MTVRCGCRCPGRGVLHDLEEALEGDGIVPRDVPVLRSFVWILRGRPQRIYAAHHEDVDVGGLEDEPADGVGDARMCRLQRLRQGYQ